VAPIEFTYCGLTKSFLNAGFRKGNGMFQRMIGEISMAARHVMQQALLALLMLLALLVMSAFLCAALFIHLYQSYGLIDACLANAGIFFAVAVVMGLIYLTHRRTKKPPAPAPRSPVQSALADPMLLATGLQIGRAIGFKRLIPVLLLGGLALGFLAGRPSSENQESPAE